MKYVGIVVDRWGLPATKLPTITNHTPWKEQRRRIYSDEVPLVDLYRFMRFEKRRWEWYKKIGKI